jgi:hypothetical protein
MTWKLVKNELNLIGRSCPICIEQCLVPSDGQWRPPNSLGSRV